MSIDRFFDTLFSVSRMTWTGDLSEESVVGTFEGQLQMIDLETVANVTGMSTKSNYVWCAVDTDVQVGDTLTDPDGQTYSVRGIQKMNFDSANNKHLQLLVEEDEILLS